MSELEDFPEFLEEEVPLPGSVTPMIVLEGGQVLEPQLTIISTIKDIDLLLSFIETL